MLTTEGLAASVLPFWSSLFALAATCEGLPCQSKPLGCLPISANCGCFWLILVPLFPEVLPQQGLSSVQVWTFDLVREATLIPSTILVLRNLSRVSQQWWIQGLFQGEGEYLDGARAPKA